MRYNRLYCFVCFVFVLLIGASICVAEQQQYKEFSDAEIEAFIVRGEALAYQYTEPSFLEPLLDPQKAAHERQEQWNRQLLGTVTLPLGPASLSANIYYADVLYGAHGALAWLLEWWLYTALNNAFIDEAAAALEQARDEQEIVKHVTFLSKRSVALLLVYVIANHVLEQAKETYLLSEWQGAPAIGSLIHVMPAMLRQIAGCSVAPHAVVTTINAFFSRLGWMPAWSERFATKIVKEYGAQLLWLRWYQKKIIQPALTARVACNAQAIAAVQKQLVSYAAADALSLQQKQEVIELRAALALMLRVGVMPSFSSWFGYKVAHLGFWLSISNLLIATPAWYTLGRFVYQMYQQLTPPVKQEECYA